MKLLVYLFNYGNSGEYFYVRIEGTREDAEKVLSTYSNDVRFLGEKTERKRDNGKRKIGNVIIRNCARHG